MNGLTHRHDRTTSAVAARGTTVRRDDDIGRAEARARFGGLDIPATLVGMLAALAMSVLLGGIAAAAISAYGHETGTTLDGAKSLGAVGLVSAIVVVFVSFVVGGWSAARMARYDGVRNGAMTAAWAILLSAIFTLAGVVFGSQYDVFGQVNVPEWSTRSDATTIGIIALAIALVAAFVGGMLGGAWGERFHRRADATVAGTRDGGIENHREGVR
ncbi:MAG: hypothetical protein JWN41_1395 [Thermoleophilia bacterium]|nr:hypothetical protein [Thermoleophilia bacterium]